MSTLTRDFSSVKSLLIQNDVHTWFNAALLNF